MIPALEIPADIDLGLFSAYLHQSGIAHRITLEGVNQVVWVERDSDREPVVRLYQEVSSGRLVLQDTRGQRTGRLTAASRLVANIWQYPITMSLVALNLLVFPFSLEFFRGDTHGLFARLMLTDFEIIDGTVLFSDLADTLANGEYWRLITPMFVHFGWMHIVFNLLWVWEIGRRIELVNGSSVLLLVTLTSSLCADMLQYFLSGPGLFGGMSGVVFGYLGHTLVWDRLVPQKPTGVRSGIYVFMLVFLVAGFSGAIDLLGLGSLANGAHLGGLLGGILTGLFTGLLLRPVSR